MKHWKKEEATGRVDEGDTFCLGILINPSECVRVYVCTCARTHTFMQRQRERENRQKESMKLKEG